MSHELVKRLSGQCSGHEDEVPGEEGVGCQTVQSRDKESL